MTTFAQIHMGDKVQLDNYGDGWLAPLRILTEPETCQSGCLRCRAITLLGKVIPVHARADHLIRLLEHGPASEPDAACGAFLAEHVKTDTPNDEGEHA